MNTCSNCGEPVASRRPSKTGEHWCNAGPCQAAKQRFYYARRNQKGAEVEADLIRKLVYALAHLERVECHGCGLETAVPGFAHRDGETGLKPCYAIGNLGPGLPPGVLDTIHPERVPSA